MKNKPTPPEQPVVSPERDADEFVVFKRNHFYSVLVVLAFAVGILVGYLTWGLNGPAQPAVAAPAQAPGGQAAAAPGEGTGFTRYDIPVDGFPSLGPEEAEIVLVEFGDYQ